MTLVDVRADRSRRHTICGRVARRSYGPWAVGTSFGTLRTSVARSRSFLWPSHATKAPDCRYSRDGETRTRTGDTTIFREQRSGGDRPRKACKSRDSNLVRSGATALDPSGTLPGPRSPNKSAAPATPGPRATLWRRGSRTPRDSTPTTRVDDAGAGPPRQAPTDAELALCDARLPDHWRVYVAGRRVITADAAWLRESDVLDRAGSMLEHPKGPWVTGTPAAGGRPMIPPLPAVRTAASAASGTTPTPSGTA
jgi:hypothetical protein